MRETLHDLLALDVGFIRIERDHVDALQGCEPRPLGGQEHIYNHAKSFLSCLVTAMTDFIGGPLGNGVGNVRILPLSLQMEQYRAWKDEHYGEEAEGIIGETVSKLEDCAQKLFMKLASVQIEQFDTAMTNKDCEEGLRLVTAMEPLGFLHRKSVTDRALALHLANLQAAQHQQAGADGGAADGQMVVAADDDELEMGGDWLAEEEEGEEGEQDESA